MIRRAREWIKDAAPVVGWLVPIVLSAPLWLWWFWLLLEMGGHDELERLDHAHLRTAVWLGAAGLVGLGWVLKPRHPEDP